jgi:drug/metabolite transporter (DMT)-like permease
MSPTVFAVVLFAALLHAGWNALVKSSGDKAASMLAVVVGQGVVGALLLPLAPVPDPACLPWLAAGVALHLGYNFFLIKAYQVGDFTQVYPIARGVSPLLVALVTAAFLGASFQPPQVAAILMISLGIASTSLARRADGLFQGKAALLALITGTFIAGYSVVDGEGARRAGTALGFYGWLAVADALLFLGISALVRPGLLRRGFALRRQMLTGGGASFLAYLMVVWAFTQAPIALVTALRETSIVFALLIGVFVMHERIRLAKIVSIALTLSGAVLLRLSKS